jgi:hypothetical protein
VVYEILFGGLRDTFLLYTNRPRASSARPCHPAQEGPQHLREGGRPLLQRAEEGTSHSPSRVSHACQPRVPEGKGASQPVLPLCVLGLLARLLRGPVGGQGPARLRPSATRAPSRDPCWYGAETLLPSPDLSGGGPLFLSGDLLPRSGIILEGGLV